MASEQGSLLLRRQLRDLTKNPVEGFSAGLINDDNIYEWEVLVIGTPDTLYEGGFFKAHLIFPTTYPMMPPTMKFHPPGDDKYGYEKASERWSPVHTVETILISVISMLSSPNDESPANIEAAKEWREDYPAFKKKVQRIVRRSADML
ncbi:Ubiquitin-conjugating enzyme E2 15 [Umbelopsis nana]